MHNAKVGGFRFGHFKATNCNVSTLINMLAQHEFIIHFVNMIARQNNNIFGAIIRDNISVLVHSICRATIPHVLGHSLAGGQNIKTFISFWPQKVPATLQMADQAMRFILRGHAKAADAGIQSIG